jgi:hypothetical protein
MRRMLSDAAGAECQLGCVSLTSLLGGDAGGTCAIAGNGRFFGRARSA